MVAIGCLGHGPIVYNFHVSPWSRSVGYRLTCADRRHVFNCRRLDDETYKALTLKCTPTSRQHRFPTSLTHSARSTISPSKTILLTVQPHPVDFGTVEGGHGTPLMGHTRGLHFDGHIDPCECLHNSLIINPLCTDSTCNIGIVDVTIQILLSVLRFDRSLLGNESAVRRTLMCIAPLTAPVDELTVDDAIEFLKTRVRLQTPDSFASCAQT